MQHAQSDNFITHKHYVKNHDARKSLTIDTRNQFQPLENVIEEQPNNNELKMAQKTTKNLRNDPTISSGTDPSHNNFVSSNVENYINNIRRSENKRMLKNIATTSANYKKIINCRKLHC